MSENQQRGTDSIKNISNKYTQLSQRYGIRVQKTLKHLVFYNISCLNTDVTLQTGHQQKTGVISCISLTGCYTSYLSITRYLLPVQFVISLQVIPQVQLIAALSAFHEPLVNNFQIKIRFGIVWKIRHNLPWDSCNVPGEDSCTECW